MAVAPLTIIAAIALALVVFVVIIRRPKTAPKSVARPKDGEAQPVGAGTVAPGDAGLAGDMPLEAAISILEVDGVNRESLDKRRQAVVFKTSFY